MNLTQVTGPSVKGRNVVTVERTVHAASEGRVELLLFEEIGAMTYTPSVSQRDSLSTTRTTYRKTG